MPKHPVPDEYHTVTPYLTVEGVPQLIAFLEAVFDADVTERIPGPGGGVMHAEVRIGNSMVMMGEARDDHRPMPAGLYVYVEDVDEIYRRAVEAGGISLQEPTDQFYGDRSAGVRGPSGNHWFVASRLEKGSPEELARRAAERGGADAGTGPDAATDAE